MKNRVISVLILLLLLAAQPAAATGFCYFLVKCISCCYWTSFPEDDDNAPSTVYEKNEQKTNAKEFEESE